MHDHVISHLWILEKKEADLPFDAVNIYRPYVVFYLYDLKGLQGTFSIAPPVPGKTKILNLMSRFHIGENELSNFCTNVIY